MERIRLFASDSFHLSVHTFAPFGYPARYIAAVPLRNLLQKIFAGTQCGERECFYQFKYFYCFWSFVVLVNIVIVKISTLATPAAR